VPEVEDGRWLIEHRFELERGEAAWLVRLGEFDAAGGWCADGQLSCVEWLTWFVKMGRSTAFEKLRVARQLRRRPVIADAFGSGRVSYSAVRAITRAEDADPEVDEALVQVAETGSPADVERAVRTYQAYRDQDLPPAELVARRRGVRLRRGGDGLVRVEGYLTELEAAELEAALAGLINREDSPISDGPGEGQSPAGDSNVGADTGEYAGEATLTDERDNEAAGQSPAGDWVEDHAVGLQHWAARQADAFMNLVRTGAAHIDPPNTGGADRHLVHVIVGPDGAASLIDGTPLQCTEAARVACDTALVEHRVNDAGEPLSLGRKTREWSTAQRRAALVRDGGHCRFPACRRRTADLHHHHWWERGGPTDIANGYLLCPHHHTLVHKGGFTAEGHPNHALTFHRPDGQPLGATTPTGRRAQPV
jgi:hypothetical protein